MPEPMVYSADVTDGAPPSLAEVSTVLWQHALIYLIKYYRNIVCTTNIYDLFTVLHFRKKWSGLFERVVQA